jgi:hypothetical protein
VRVNALIAAPAPDALDYKYSGSGGL